MGLINTEIEININGRNAGYYENLGYEIPKYWDKRNNCFRVKNGTKIIVKITKSRDRKWGILIWMIDYFRLF